MIIDIHTHTFPPAIAANALSQMQHNCHTALFSDGTEEGLRQNERLAGIGLAVVQPVATNPEKLSHINDRVLLSNQEAAQKGVLSFGAMHPACSYWEKELERLKAAGVPGIKLHPPYQETDMDDPKTIAVLKKCKALDLIVLIHSGKDVGIPKATEALPAKIRRALDAVGPLRLIAAHMGGWGCWTEVQSLLSDTGIYLDTAFSLGSITPAPDDYQWQEKDLALLDESSFCDLIRAFGSDHILFGTDSPWADPSREVQKIKALPLPPNEIQSILGGNAQTLLSC